MGSFRRWLGRLAAKWAQKERPSVDMTLMKRNQLIKRRDSLLDTQTKLDAQIKQLLQKGDRQQASKLVLRKTQITKDLGILDGILWRIDKLEFEIESSTTQSEALAILEALGAKHQQVQSMVDVDSINSVISRIQEADTNHSRLMELIQPASVADEHNVEKTLDKLEALVLFEQLDKQIASVPVKGTTRSRASTMMATPTPIGEYSP